MPPDLQAALVLGIVEGLTEFLPVSSTGHLILCGRLLEFSGEKADTFDIFIQLGAILAVVVLYFPRFTALFELRSNSPSRGWRGLLQLGAACLPAFVLGALLHRHIKALLFSPLPVAAALIAGGLVMIAVERRERSPSATSIEAISPLQALFIGMFQCFALWPGVSRSASTIIGALLLGTDRKTAAEFSFIVAVPVMTAAVSFDLLQSVHLLSTADIPVFAAGFIVSFVTAIAAIRFFLALLNRVTLAPFGVYRIALGAAVLLVHYAS